MLQHDKNLFMFGGFPYIEIFTFFSSIIGLFLIKFAPSEGVDMSLAVSVPLACVGFIIAATWIDAIADQLVKLLTLLGVICRIPGAIMGLTVLAWGNSMGDLSANMTMAKKGLANMAITACFAGPVFNILIGLGGGFAKLNASTGQASTEVVLTPSIIVGLCFLAVNCLLVVVSGLVVNSGHIPKGYGYVALGLYIIYVFTSIALQFYDPDQEE
jgi:sodium/potassium/calcium exchanger 6